MGRNERRPPFGGRFDSCLGLCEGHSVVFLTTVLSPSASVWVFFTVSPWRLTTVLEPSSFLITVLDLSPSALSLCTTVVVSWARATPAAPVVRMARAAKPAR